MKEKRCRRFSASDFFVNYIFKFLNILIAIKNTIRDLNHGASAEQGEEERINPSSTGLATSAKREVPRATCNERGARSSPRRNSQASPIKEKLVRRFLTLDLLFPYAVFHGIINTAMYIERSRDNFLSFPLFALQNTVRAVIVLRQSIAACGSYYIIRGCYDTTERFKDRRKS